jgi:Tol biopolymer transport system component
MKKAVAGASARIRVAMNLWVLIVSLSVLGLNTVTPVVAQSPGPAFQYHNPVVFQRAHLDGTGTMSLRSKLWMMEADGTSLRQLTFGDTYDDHPSIYADREHILFAEFPVNALDPRAHSRLIRLNFYTGTREVIEDVDGCSVHHATLSPIDDLVAYHRDCGAHGSHWIGTGADARQVSTHVTDGVRTRTGLIAAYDLRSRSSGGLALVELDPASSGLQARIIVKKRGNGSPLAVSPDARWLAWDEDLTNGDSEIFVGRSDGTNVRSVTAMKAINSHPWFSRDGRWLVYHSNRSGHFEIWRTDLESQRSEQLTFGDGEYDSTRPRM